MASQASTKCLQAINEKLAQSNDDHKVVAKIDEHLVLTETTINLMPDTYVMTRQGHVVAVRFLNEKLLLEVKELLDKEKELQYEQVQPLVLWVYYADRLPMAKDSKRLT